MKPDERACAQLAQATRLFALRRNLWADSAAGALLAIALGLPRRSHAGRSRRPPALPCLGRAGRGARRWQPAPGLACCRSPRHSAPLGCEPRLASGCRRPRSSRWDKHFCDDASRFVGLYALWIAERTAGRNHPLRLWPALPLIAYIGSDGPFACRGRGSSTRCLRARSCCCRLFSSFSTWPATFEHREKSFSSSWAYWPASSWRARS